MRFRKPKKQVKKTKPEKKRADFDKAIEKAIGKKYDRKLRKKEKSGLFYYMLKNLGLRK